MAATCGASRNGEETMSMENSPQRSMQAEREKEPRRGKDSREAGRGARRQGQEQGQQEAGRRERKEEEERGVMQQRRRGEEVGAAMKETSHCRIGGIVWHCTFANMCIVSSAPEQRAGRTGATGVTPYASQPDRAARNDCTHDSCPWACEGKHGATRDRQRLATVASCPEVAGRSTLVPMAAAQAPRAGGSWAAAPMVTLRRGRVWTNTTRCVESLGARRARTTRWADGHPNHQASTRRRSRTRRGSRPSGRSDYTRWAGRSRRGGRGTPGAF